MCVCVCTYSTVCLFPGRLNVGSDELDDMLKEAPGPINFTVFLSMFGEKLKGTLQLQLHQWHIDQPHPRLSRLTNKNFPGTDPEENILNAFKIFDPEGTGVLKGDEWVISSLGLLFVYHTSVLHIL